MWCLRVVWGWWREQAGMPILVLVTIRNVNKGDEVLTDYGPHYWQDFELREKALACGV